MSKSKGIRVLSMLALCAVLVCSFSLTAFAYADDTEQNLPVTEATQPEEMPEYQDKLSQSLIRGWRKQFPEWTDERIIEELEAL